MSNVYRTMSPRSRPPSPWGRAVFWCVAGLGAVGVCVGGVWWFRRAEPTPSATTEDGGEGATLAMAAVPEVYDAMLTLQPVNGAAAGGTARRSHVLDVYDVGISAQLPAIDPATTAYEVWFVKPGITDFFSLGELYPLADDGWGLAWSQTDALVRNDIEEFDRLIIIREPRDGNPAPSVDQVLTGVFE